ncbi:hypothetical protein [Paenibacillus sp. Y412MC10]|uniref:hypothetical protein n=1 Tax=Geobacillus sp. (strain Y412MC10) TaxID=481743 RepID=UPI0011A2CF60|nr:hypothetical protein [Paenibacillus sp. Y412MC10]
MTTTQTTQSIQERITNLIEILKQDEKNVRQLQDELRNANERVNNSAQNVVLMQRMAQIAGYEENITQWQEKLNDNFSANHDYEWTETHKLQTLTLKIQIVIAKHRKLKKYKHVVKVNGQQLYISENIGQVSESYQDSDYIKNKYKDKELEKKFVNLADAREFVQAWKTQIEDDHKEVLQEHRDLYQQFKRANLIYKPEQTKKMSLRRNYDQPLTALQQVGIFNKNEINELNL